MTFLVPGDQPFPAISGSTPGMARFVQRGTKEKTCKAVVVGYQ